MLIDLGNDDGSMLVLDVPVDFHLVPLDPSIERRTAAQLRVIDDMGLSDSGQREALSLYLEAMAIRLAAADDVVSTAFCAVDLGGQPSTATLTVALHDVHTDDPGLAVLGAAEAMRRDGSLGQVEIVELGQRTVTTARCERRIGPDQAPSAAPATVRELSVFVPVPQRRQAVMVVVSTPCLADWETYESLTMAVCRTLYVGRPRQAALS